MFLSLPPDPWVALDVRTGGSLPLRLEVYGVSSGGLSESVVRIEPALAFRRCWPDAEWTVTKEPRPDPPILAAESRSGR